MAIPTRLFLFRRWLMIGGRCSSFVPWLLLAVSGLAWLLVGSRLMQAHEESLFAPTSRHVSSSPGQTGPRSEAACVKLSTDPGTGQLLVIGSLGNAEDTFDVALVHRPHGVSQQELDCVRQIAAEYRHASSRGFSEKSKETVADVPCFPHSAWFQAGTDIAEMPGPDSLLADRRLSLSENRSVRHFDIHVGHGGLDDASQYVRFAADLVGEGRTVRVYLDREQCAGQLSGGLVSEIVRIMDEDVVPGIGRFLGQPPDVDQDGRLAIVLSPKLGRLQGGAVSVLGFVRPGDFRSDFERPFSNQSDVIYLNSGAEPNALLRDILAHEFVHAACLSAAHTAEDGREPHLGEDWISEGLAHQFETGAENLDYRVDAFLRATESAPLVVSDYYRSQRWRDPATRGASFLFIRWAVRNFGEHWLRDLSACGGDSPLLLESTTGVSFSELFREWSLAMVQPQTDLNSRPRLPVIGQFGRYRLSGPRIRHWVPQNRPLKLRLSGTAVAYVRLLGREPKHRGEVLISAPLGTGLQVTAIRGALGHGKGGPAAVTQHLMGEDGRTPH